MADPKMAGPKPVGDSLVDPVINDKEPDELEKSPPRADTFDPKLVKTIRRIIDWRLIPALGAMYGINLLDRKNVANAAIAGMLDDLDMRTGIGYNLANMMFFVPYILFQSFLVILCRKIGPHIFLPGICLIWGGVIVAFGFAQNWHTIVGLRAILGALEGGYLPGCLYLLSCWYTRFELATRYSLFYLISSLASAMSGILAYGLMQMEGTAGIRGWRWIFIMEGVITCGVAMFSALFLIKFPDEEVKKPSFKFLSQDQIKFTLDRINAERGDADSEPFSWRKFFEPANEWFIYGFPALFFLFSVVAYAFGFTLPIILQQKLKFSLVLSQCLGAPPYFASSVLMYGAGWVSDRYKIRAPVTAALATLSFIGLPIMAFAQNPWVQYFGVFLSVAGTNSGIPTVMAYQANNIRGQWRRAFCSACFTGIGALGGIIGSVIFQAKDGPMYLPGFVTCMVANILILVILLGMSTYFRRMNKLADRGEVVLLDDPNFRFVI